MEISLTMAAPLGAELKCVLCGQQLGWIGQPPGEHWCATEHRIREIVREELKRVTDSAEVTKP